MRHWLLTPLRRVALAALAAGGLLFAPGLRASRLPPFGGVVRLGVPRGLSPKKLDPLGFGRTYEGRLMVLLTHNGLYQLDQQGLPQPVLAAGEKISPDGKTWLITLRPDVVMHSGKLLNARDVAASLRRAAKDKTHGALLMALAGWPRRPDITAADPGTVRLVLARPEPRLKHLLAQPPLFITQADLPRLGPGSWGTGPFFLPRDKPGVFKAFEGYLGGRPYLDQITLVEHRGGDEAALDFKRQRLDAVVLQPAQAAELKARLLPTTLPQVAFLEFSCRLGLAQRRAIARSVSAQDLLDVYFRQKGRTVNSLPEALGLKVNLGAGRDTTEPTLQALSELKKRPLTLTHATVCGAACAGVAHRLGAALGSRGLKARVMPPQAAKTYDVMVKTVFPSSRDALPLYRQEHKSLSRCGVAPPAQAQAIAPWIHQRLAHHYLVGTPLYFAHTPAMAGVRPGPYNVADLENLWMERGP